MWDLRDASGEAVFGQPGRIYFEPLSIRALADNIGQDADPLAPLGDQRSGCQRDQLTRECDEALSAFSDAAHRLYTSEFAAILLMRMCARVPEFEAPEWLKDLFHAHLEVLKDVAAYGSEHGRETDYSEGREDGD